MSLGDHLVAGSAGDANGGTPSAPAVGDFDEAELEDLPTTVILPSPRSRSAPSTIPVAPGRAPRLRDRRRWIIAGGVACVAAIGLLVATIVSDGPPPAAKPQVAPAAKVAPPTVTPLPQPAAPPPAMPAQRPRAPAPVDVPIVSPPREAAPETPRPAAPKPRAAVAPKPREPAAPKAKEPPAAAPTEPAATPPADPSTP